MGQQRNTVPVGQGQRAVVPGTTQNPQAPPPIMEQPASLGALSQLVKGAGSSGDELPVSMGAMDDVIPPLDLTQTTLDLSNVPPSLRPLLEMQHNKVLDLRYPVKK